MDFLNVPLFQVDKQSSVGGTRTQVPPVEVPIGALDSVWPEWAIFQRSGQQSSWHKKPKYLAIVKNGTDKYNSMDSL